MSFTEFKAGRTEIEAANAKSQVFDALIPLADRMYRCVRDLSQARGSPTIGRLLMLCHREFLVAATLIQSGLPYDSAANTRRAIEIAKVALALKRDPTNAEKWMQAAERQARWDARRTGQKPKSFQSPQFPDVSNDPLFKTLQDYFGMYSAMYVHFTPEFFGIQRFQKEPTERQTFILHLDYFATDRAVLSQGIILCGLHSRILVLFDACFDHVVSVDPGWQMLKATCDQLGADLFKALPPVDDNGTCAPHAGKEV
jgi:hypothetical protein